MDPRKLQADLIKTRRQLVLLYEIGNLMRSTLNFDETVFLILSVVTSHEGLGFNRAVLFLADPQKTRLTGAMGVGPANPERAAAIWHDITQNEIHLQAFLDIFRKSGGQIDEELNQIVRSLWVDLSHPSEPLTKVFISDKPFAALSDETRSRISDRVLDRLGARHFVAVPVRGKDETIGVLVVDNFASHKIIDRADILNLSMVADHGGLAIQNARVFDRALIASKKDSLTGLWNHAHFQDILLQALKTSELHHLPVSLVLFDVDDFKRYNDHLGHQQGDRALRFISEVALRNIRKSDAVCRYGGEEFAMILPATTKEQAILIAEKLRHEIEQESLRHHNMNPLKPLTISMGVASSPQDTSEREKLIYCADAALYTAKSLGKNTVISFDNQPAEVL
ncbi:MAG: sensor domain-containing diguanylate cyclase [Candidatus Omnitrophica bacterium]|nr:sensor domain-containing diguanylate cyclase [Candidatus Omnitrophota bacterium]